MDILDSIENKIGNTPLLEITNIKIPNGNRIFYKEEFLNPTGSHYDRIYLSLFKDLESKKKIIRGKTQLIEVSSGNAGASFAWFCKKLGYPCTVILPRRLPEPFIDNIHNINPKVNIVISEGNSYLKGAVETLRKKLSENRNLFCMNHSRQDTTISATEQIAVEASHQIEKYGIKRLDYYIPACGNGSTIVGPGRYLKKWFGTKVIIFESANAPVGYHILHPEKKLSFSYHSLYGTGAWGVYFPFLQGQKYGFRSLVDEDIRITEEDIQRSWELVEGINVKVGSTSLVSLALALRVASSINGKNILILFYDKGDKYERPKISKVFT